MTGRRYIRSRKINLDNVGFFITDNGIWFSFIWNMLFPMDITVYNSIECRSFISRFTLKWNAVYRIKQSLLELRLNLFGAFLVFPRFIVDIPKTFNLFIRPQILLELIKQRRVKSVLRRLVHTSC